MVQELAATYPSNVISLTQLLFLCFVNDIPLNVTSKIRLYANDIKTHGSVLYGQGGGRITPRVYY